MKVKTLNGNKNIIGQNIKKYRKEEKNVTTKNMQAT